jgi:hypothetical protein
MGLPVPYAFLKDTLRLPQFPHTPVSGEHRRSRASPGLRSEDPVRPPPMRTQLAGPRGGARLPTSAGQRRAPTFPGSIAPRRPGMPRCPRLRPGAGYAGDEPAGARRPRQRQLPLSLAGPAGPPLQRSGVWTPSNRQTEAVERRAVVTRHASRPSPLRLRLTDSWQPAGGNSGAASGRHSACPAAVPSTPARPRLLAT